MLATLSVTERMYGAGYASMNAYAQQGSAVSPAAKEVRKAVSAQIRFSEGSQALFGEKAAAISTLHALASECDKPDWDGNMAEAIDPTALHNAENLVRSLPNGLPMPEFSPEPDGSISLDWIESRCHLFSLSVGSSNRLSFAWLDGTDKGHGVAGFDGFTIPARVLSEIRKVFDRAPLRAA